MSELQLDRAGRRRSPTMPEFLAGRPPRNKGLRYPADPPKVEEIVAVMSAAGDGAHGRRLRGLIVILWRAGLHIQEALALTEADLDQRRGSLLVRRGKGGRRREVGMDDWGWQELQPWLERRLELPIGALFCVITGATGGRPWATAAARAQFRRTAAAAGVRDRSSRKASPGIAVTTQLAHVRAATTASGYSCRRLALLNELSPAGWTSRHAATPCAPAASPGRRSANGRRNPRADSP